MSKELDVAIEAAKVAGEVLVKHFETGGGKKTAKHKHDFATEADFAAEKIVIDILSKNFPSHSILSEEAGATEKESEYRWIIDPLDGTHNFAWGIPLWGISIALQKSDKIIVGVIFIPMTNEMFTAEKGKGAFLNGKKIKVSDRKHPDAILNFDGLWAMDEVPFARKMFDSLYPKFHEHLRFLGSAVYEMASVAAGNLDGGINLYMNPWDIAAGILLVEEAGGIVRDVNGSPLVMKPTNNNLIFSNKLFYEDIMKVLKI